MFLEELLKELRHKVDFPFTIKSLERIIRAINTTNDFWEIVDYSDEPLPLVTKLIKLLEDNSLLKISSSIKLTKKGENVLAPFGTFQWIDLKCNKCAGRTISSANYKAAFNKFIKIQKDRPIPKIEYDQGYITPESLFAKIALADSKGDLGNKQILILGDDDLLSIALALTKLPAQIIVLEIDTRLIDFISKISNKFKLKIETHQKDLAESFPKEFLNKFDTFFTDPSETITSFNAFIGRGVASLKKTGGCGYFGLTHREASLYKWNKLQHFILEMNTVVTDIIYNFQDYVNWGYEKDMRAWHLSPLKKLPRNHWYRSCLFRIETLPNFKGFNLPLLNHDLFNDSESSTT